ncbi:MULTISPECIES: OmpA family protein [unclassified Campylobacter]|uniref:OmpA family protein n=1 Tax=unclassified Campylobacter TaxID=2593542 RepID=UPI003D357B07
MKLNNKQTEEQTFWVSYADLMAGLLFVFMLIIGAVVVKYVLSQNTIAKQDATISAALANLKDEQGKNLSLDKLNTLLKDELEKASSANLALQNKNEVIIVELQALKKRISRLSQENSDANASILSLQTQNLELNKTTQDLQTRLILLDDELEKSKNDLDDANKTNIKNLEQIAALLSQISDKETRYNLLLTDLNTTQSRIKNLTGIRVKVISELKEKLGSSIEIDQNSGAMKLSSSVLFDKKDATLKDEAKAELKQTLTKYFDVLLNDKEISKNIDQIMIEGFTDSDGSYIYNLELSQRRAYAVMEFINSFYKDDRLRKLLVASGRSYNDLILKDGVEDKDASRRIELKFQLSNKEAMREIEKFLEQKR